jgi:hypothetical protein
MTTTSSFPPFTTGHFLVTHFTLYILKLYNMPSLATFTNPKPYHIISYGTLLGSTLFQSFIAGPFAYSALPRPQFSTLQQKIFPTYFAFQTALPVVLALTWPGANVAGKAFRNDAGWRGVLETGNFWDALVPIGLMFGTGLLNMVLLGPATTKVMRERKHQGTC